MSSQATGWAFKQSPSGGALSKLVLVALADQANQDNEAWPSVGYVANRCQMGVSTVRAHLGKLEAEGLIVRTARYVADRQTSNVYYIPCDPDAERATAAGVLHREGGDATSGGGETPRAGGGGPRAGGTGVHQRATEPIIGTTIEPSTTALALIGGTGPTAPAVRAQALPAIVGKPTGAALVQRLAVVFDEIKAGTRERVTAEQRRKLQAGTVFAYWMHKFDKPRSMMDPKREGVAVKRLEENNGDVSELLFAIDGAFNDEWCRKNNHKFEWVLRDRGAVEEFANTRKKYRDGAQHDLARKYADVIAEEIEGGPLGEPVTVVNAPTTDSSSGGTNERSNETPTKDASAGPDTVPVQRAG